MVPLWTLVAILTSFTFLSCVSAQNCGSQLLQLEKCSGDVFEKYHPEFYENRKKAHDQTEKCFTKAGCKSPSEIVRGVIKAIILNSTKKREGEENYGKGDDMHMRKKRQAALDIMMSDDFSDCFLDEIIRKTIFPAMESCMGKMFKLPGYKLPILFQTFEPRKHGYDRGGEEMEHEDGSGDEWDPPEEDMEGMRHKRQAGSKAPKKSKGKGKGGKDIAGEWMKVMTKGAWIDKAGKENLMILAASGLDGFENFDIDDLKTAGELIFMAGQVACKTAEQKEQVETCLIKISKTFWTDANLPCKAPVAMVFGAIDKVESFCSDMDNCHSKLTGKCVNASKYEAEHLCECAATLPLKAIIRKKVKEGLIKCMKIPAPVLMDKGFNYWLYDKAVYKAEAVVHEFCSLQRKNPCEEVFGDDGKHGKGKQSKKGKGPKKGKKKHENPGSPGGGPEQLMFAGSWDLLEKLI